MTKEEKKMFQLKHKLTQLRDVPHFVCDQLSKDGFCDMTKKKDKVKGLRSEKKEDQIRGLEDFNPNDDFTKLMTPAKNTQVREL